MTEKALHRLTSTVVVICVAPMVAAALAAFPGDLDTWRNVLASILPIYTIITLLLVVIVGVSKAVIGIDMGLLITDAARHAGIGERDSRPADLV